MRDTVHGLLWFEIGGLESYYRRTLSSFRLAVDDSNAGTAAVHSRSQGGCECQNGADFLASESEIGD
jgi:hypothetical protein